MITDALNMGAIVSRYGAAQAAVLAFKAGADILLMPADAAAAIDALTAAVQTGEVPEARLDSSVARLFAAKSHAGLWGRRTVDLSRIAGTVGTAEHAALALDIAQRSLVLVKDSLGTVPLTAERRRHVVVVTFGDDANRDAGSAFLAALRPGVDTLRAYRLWPASGPASYDSVRSAAQSASAVVVVAAARPTAWRPDAIAIPAALALLIEELSLADRRVVLVSTGSPYLLAQAPRVAAYLLAWSGADASERAAAQALLGQTPITGKLPVSLPPGFPLGGGLQRTLVIK